MPWIAWPVVALAALVGGVLGVGARLPREHVVTRRIRLNQPVEPVWTRIADRGSEPAWRKGLRSVTREADRDGHAVWREQGGENLTLQDAVVEPPHRLVRRILGNRMFGGEWEFALEASGEGCVVAITERGEVYQPLARFFSRYVMGLTRTVDTYLGELASSFGETATIEDGSPLTVAR